MKLLPLLCLLLLVGCHKGSDLAGKWQSKANWGGSPAHVLLELHDDTTWTRTTTVSSNMLSMTQTMKGHWQSDGNLVTMGVEDLTYSVKGDPSVAAAIQQQFEARKAQEMELANRTPGRVIRHVSDGRLMLSTATYTETFTPVK